MCRIHDMTGNAAPPRIDGANNGYGTMTSFLKSSFVWQFAGGFVLGAIGLVALQPAAATHELVSRFAPAQQVR